jgi:hypothetical protein
VSPFFEFARCCSGHVERSWRVGPAPKCRRSAFWEGPKRSLQSVLCYTFQTCFGRNRDPTGARNAKQKTECRWAPESPEEVTEHKAGYKTADTFQSKVLICTRVAEVQRNGGAIRADISSARTAVVATDVAGQSRSQCRDGDPPLFSDTYIDHLPPLRHAPTRLPPTHVVLTNAYDSSSMSCQRCTKAWGLRRQTELL